MVARATARPERAVRGWMPKESPAGFHLEQEMGMQSPGTQREHVVCAEDICLKADPCEEWRYQVLLPRGGTSSSNSTMGQSRDQGRMKSQHWLGRRVAKDGQCWQVSQPMTPNTDRP